MSGDLTIEHLLEGLDGLANMASLFFESQNRIRERRFQAMLEERRKLRLMLEDKLTLIAVASGRSH